MNKTELKSLAQRIASEHPCELLEEDALEIELEVRNIFLKEEEFKILVNEMQEIVERCNKPLA